jgi:predicted secreted protein
MPRQITPSINQEYTNYTNVFNIMIIDESKNNSFITVPRNSTFELHVKGNPTTGYGVYLKNYNSIDKTYLRFENLIYDNVTNLYRSDEYAPQNIMNNKQNLVGSGGFYVFRMTTLQDFNNIFVSFVKIQPWDLSSETGKINLKLTTFTSPYNNSPLLNQNAGTTINNCAKVEFNLTGLLISFALLFI